MIEEVEGTRETATVPNERAGERFDRVLSDLFPDYSRSRLQQWIRDGHVTLDGRVPRPRDRVRGGERVDLERPREPAVELTPQAIELDVVFADDQVLVINKPPGLVVHPGAGNPDGTLQNALLHYAPELDRVPRAGLVHRLDKDTSGLLVIARSEAAHTRLTEMMQEREIRREYEAVVAGTMTGGGRVDEPIARHPVDRKRMAVRPGGREAVTHYRLLRRFRAHTHLLVRLETGRTHQIRVHLAHIRHPVVGDPVYGRRPVFPKGASDEVRIALSGFRRQALHARHLTFRHPASGEELRFSAPLASDMRRLLEILERDEREAGGNG